MAEILTGEECYTLSRAIDTLRGISRRLSMNDGMAPMTDLVNHARVATIVDEADHVVFMVLNIASAHGECENAQATLNARAKR